MKKGFTLFELLTVLAVIVVLLFFLILPTCQAFSRRDVIITVSRRERTGGDSGKYLVYAEGEVFEDTDWWLKRNSSDVYNQLKEGGTYKVDVVGWRVPVFSWYRNIIKVKEVIQASSPAEAPATSPTSVQSTEGNFCPNCGASSQAGHFCSSCGHKLK